MYSISINRIEEATFGGRMKVTAIVGSPRPEGNTSFIVDCALEKIASYGIDTKKIILSQYKVNPCQGHDKCRAFAKCAQQDDVPWILEEFRTADGIILATPVYYYNMTAQMKSFIDRNYFLYTHNLPLQARCAGLIVIAGSAGLETTVHALKRTIAISKSESDKVLVASGCAFKRGDARNNKDLIIAAQKLGDQMSGILLSKA